MKKVKLLAIALLMFFVCSVLVSPVVQAQSATPPQSAPEQKKSTTRNLAIFIFEGVQIIDYTGPYEVFGHAWNDEQPMFNIYTVAEKAGPITTAMGMTVVPKYTFENAPKPDIVLFPGGNVRPQLGNENVIKWVNDTSAHAEYVMSVCNGAFYLGKAGLLDGLTATTFFGLIDDLKTLAPKTKVVIDQRYVDNGKIITTAGLSSGIDGALHLVEKLAGYGKAQEIALGMEYNWQPELHYARANFADRYLRKALGRQGFTLPEGTGWKVLGQQGGTDNWEKNWEVRLNSSATDLLKIIDTKLAEGWTRMDSDASHGAAKSLWKFTDEEGKQWNAVSNVQPITDEKGAYKLTIKLARKDSSARLKI